MGLLSRMVLGGGLRAETPGPTSDFWYQPAGGQMTIAGMRVDEEAAQKVSAWYRGRDILATVLAMLPFQVYEKLPNQGGSEVADAHPLYDVIHDKPNTWQDSFQWRRQAMYHLIDHGNAYNFIVPGPRGFADQLWPIPPELVTPEQLPSRRIVYRVRDPKTSTSRTYTQDEVFHLRGASDDGIVGKGILEYARTSIGTALATGSYAAAIFGKGTMTGGWIETPGVLNDEASKRMAESFVTSAGNWHLPKVLEQGAKFTPNKMTPEDAQMILSQKFGIDEMARWLGVPRQMLENSDPSFGNAEQFDQNFITYSMGGWLSLWEFGVTHQLILDPSRFFARFVRQAFVRGKFLERVQGLVALKNAAIISADEARAVEDMNKRGGRADELVEPQNITGKPDAPPDNSQAAAETQPAPIVAIEPEPDPRIARAEALARASAARLIRKEIASVQGAAKRHAKNAAAFAAAVREFYAEHAELVEQTLQVDRQTADLYCVARAESVRVHGLSIIADWQSDGEISRVASMALEVAA